MENITPIRFEQSLFKYFIKSVQLGGLEGVALKIVKNKTKVTITVSWNWERLALGLNLVVTNVPVLWWTVMINCFDADNLWKINNDKNLVNFSISSNNFVHQKEGPQSREQVKHGNESDFNYLTCRPKITNLMKNVVKRAKNNDFCAKSKLDKQKTNVKMRKVNWKLFFKSHKTSSKEIIFWLSKVSLSRDSLSQIGIKKTH